MKRYYEQQRNSNLSFLGKAKSISRRPNGGTTPPAFEGKKEIWARELLP
jgi:hypothetical protein